ncbi:BQ5605_C001g00345 [Microbotryum silenes-dioicae]|uniref:BQ5605_C001g00345 protein n=1 Tax=Microbotryum silenes-dioicae TaxID=796604 RepID=A0A2X0P5L6_9BASI|nr:BQ5605_C001g00345 [Microbotryum silenes-dioicae]
MVRSFALVKIYGMAREGRSLVSGQYPRVKARLVLLYWIAFRSAPTAQQPALEIQPREDIRRCRVKNKKKSLGLKGPPQPDDLRSFWKAVNSKALTAREREVWFKLILRFTPTRKLQHQQNHDTSPPSLVCEAPVDDTDHYFFGCFDSRNVWIAARGVLCDALGSQYTTLQRLFGLPKLKAKLSEQEGEGRTIEIFTGMVLEMISSGRYRMQKHGKRMESVERRRVVLEERMKLRVGGARGGRGQ